MQHSRKKWASRSAELIQDLPTPRQPVYESPLDGDVDGAVGKATTCDGDNPIECKDAPLNGRTSVFSYSLWVRPKSHSPRVVVLHQSRAAEDAAFRGLSLTIDDGHPQFSMIHFWPGNALRVRTKKTIPTEEWTHLTVTHDGSGRADGIQLFVNGKSVETAVVRDKLTRDIRQRKDWGDLDVAKVSLALGARFRDVGFRDGSVDDLKVFDVQLSSAEVLSLFAAVRPETKKTVDTEMALQHQLLVADEDVASARNSLSAKRDAENELVVGVREIMTMRHYEDAPPTHILGRGEYTNKGKAVSPAAPKLSGGLPEAGGSRLGLAKWITDTRNPLTSRVIANRIWHLFFGRGIVVSLEDFGSQGTPPTHPELLNHLARSLMDNDWDLHWLCREIVLSATYRQSSKVDASIYVRDPDNKWLTRGPKHRLSAEQLRDTVLATSGLLVKKIGGPSVMPYQPAGLWKESSKKTYKESNGDGLYRRSIYTFWKRTVPPPSMLTLDAIDHQRLSVKFQGLDARLTGVEPSRVVQEILS